jgi:hypothetical protein
MTKTSLHSNRRRLATVVLAPLAALAAWGLIRLIGIDLVLKGDRGSVGPVDVVVAALVGALAGWLVVRLLERHTARPWLWWPFVASAALSVSLIGPSRLADGTSAVGLIALHLVTAVVVITGFAGTFSRACARDDCRHARWWLQGNPSR